MGPLSGIKVIEVASLAPGPFAAMILGDLGADVVRIDRPDELDEQAPLDPLLRNRASIAIDLKATGAQAVVLRLVETADVLIEGFRPGVMERLGVGPEECLKVNSGLVYARMTGWGQHGPLAQRAGHDINFLGVAGALYPMGRPDEPPVPPLNLVGDFGGGGMLLVVGILAALLERSSSGSGQVIDAAIVDGAALLTASLHGMLARGTWQPQRGTNLLDGGAPFYDTYATADGHFMSVGALEGRFYAELIKGLGLEPADLPDRWDRARWPDLRERIAKAFAEHSREHWTRVFAERDACAAPVYTPHEATEAEPNVQRQVFIEANGWPQPAPAPRFSRSAPTTPHPIPRQGADTRPILAAHGYGKDDIDGLIRDGVVAVAVEREGQGR